MTSKLVPMLAALGWLGVPRTPRPGLGTAFAYQDRLNDGANPATGVS